MQIEGYEIGEVLKRTEPTTLYRARQLSLDRPVAIEVLDAGGSEAGRNAMAAECRRLAGLLHPNLVSGLACGEVDGRPYLVTELIEGRTLASAVAEGGRFGEERALGVGGQLARALAHLEKASLIHGGLSPAAVLLSSDEVAKIDRLPAVHEPGWDGRDRAGAFVGVEGYGSPEGLRGGAGRLDARSDLYSLGAVLYFLLSGVSPAEDAIGEMIDGRMIDRPVELRARCSNVGKATLSLVETLMAALPSDRLEGAAEAGARIEAAIEEAEKRTRIQSGRAHGRRSRARRSVPARTSGAVPRVRTRRRRRR